MLSQPILRWPLDGVPGCDYLQREPCAVLQEPHLSGYDCTVCDAHSAPASTRAGIPMIARDITVTRMSAKSVFNAGEATPSQFLSCLELGYMDSTQDRPVFGTREQVEARLCYGTCGAQFSSVQRVQSARKDGRVLEVLPQLAHRRDAARAGPCRQPPESADP